MGRLLAVPAAFAMMVAGIAGVLISHASLGLACFSLSVLTLGNVATSGIRAAAAAARSGSVFLYTNLTSQGLLLACAALLSGSGVASSPLWLTTYAACIAVPPSFVIFRYCRAKLATHLADTDGQVIREARRFGIRLLPSTLAAMIALRADRLMLPLLADFYQLGIYIIVATFCELAIWPIQAWVDAHVPIWHRKALKSELRIAEVLSAAAVYAILVSGALFLSLYIFLVPIFGHDYEASVRLLLPLSAGSGLYSISRVAVGLGIASGMSRVATIADMASMIAALTCYVVLIPQMGAMGAAVGSLVSYGVAAITSTTLLLSGHRRISRNPNGHENALLGSVAPESS